MKSAKLLLLLACLLIATSAIAAAYEPINGAAFAPTCQEIKTIVKEEVVLAISVNEKSAIPVVPIPAGNSPSDAFDGFVRLDFIYEKQGYKAHCFLEVDRDHSRFT